MDPCGHLLKVEPVTGLLSIATPELPRLPGAGHVRLVVPALQFHEAGSCRPRGRHGSAGLLATSEHGTTLGLCCPVCLRGQVKLVTAGLFPTCRGSAEHLSPKAIDSECTGPPICPKVRSTSRRVVDGHAQRTIVVLSLDDLAGVRDSDELVELCLERRFELETYGTYSSI